MPLLWLKQHAEPKVVVGNKGLACLLGLGIAQLCLGGTLAHRDPISPNSLGPGLARSGSMPTGAHRANQGFGRPWCSRNAFGLAGGRAWNLGCWRGGEEREGHWRIQSRAADAFTVGVTLVMGSPFRSFPGPSFAASESVCESGEAVRRLYYHLHHVPYYM